MIKHPIFKIGGRPTPRDTLYICEKCQESRWGPYRDIAYCHRGHGRMRLGTPEEIKEAKKALITII